MNSSSWSPSYRQTLRLKYYNWLTQAANATSISPGRQSIDKPHTGYARSSDTQSIATGRLRPLVDALPTINDIYLQLNGKQSVDGVTAPNYPNAIGPGTAPLPNGTLAASSLWTNASRAGQAIQSLVTIDMMHPTSAYDALQSHHAPNQTQLFDLKNITNAYNLTEDHIKDFVTKSFELGKLINVSGGVAGIATGDDVADASACHYCNGFVKDLFGGYKSIHGYMSLAVCVHALFKCQQVSLSVRPLRTSILCMRASADGHLMECVRLSFRRRFAYSAPLPTY